MDLITVTPENILKEGLFCIKSQKEEGFKKKMDWYLLRYEEGLRLKILKDGSRMLGMIEYVPAEYAWRPVNAPNSMFVQCFYIYAKKDRNRGLGKMLIDDCIQDAKEAGMSAVCTMTSDGAWIHDKRLLEKMNFRLYDKRGRFELLGLPLNGKSEMSLIDWEDKLSDYQGWHLIYADQCPWHAKVVNVIKEMSAERGINIQTRVLNSADEAKNAPSGYGVFALIRDGRLLEDHYISHTRFRNILNKELA